MHDFIFLLLYLKQQQACVLKYTVKYLVLDKKKKM